MLPKSPKNGLKISQLGKYFFATGFFINPVAKKYRSNWAFFGGWKNYYKLIALLELKYFAPHFRFQTEEDK